MSNQQSGVFFRGFLIGAALGTIAGLIVAPRSGKETRKILKKSALALPELAEDLSTTLHLHADRLSETALRNWDDTLVRLQDAIAAGLEASQREHQKLSLQKNLPSEEAEELQEEDNNDKSSN
ncbi:MAG: YtxH domain-containing protein [Microcoleaceae cyanobacterium]